MHRDLKQVCALMGGVGHYRELLYTWYICIIQSSAAAAAATLCVAILLLLSLLLAAAVRRRTPATRSCSSYKHQ